MRFSISHGFAALLALTLAGKLLAAHAAPPRDDALFLREAAAAAARAGLTSRIAQSPLGPVLHARARDCIVIAREATEGSTFAPAYARVARAVGPVVYHYRGAATQEAPNAFASADHQIWRGLNRLGIATSRHPVLAVAASPGCRPRALDWSALESLPA